MGEAVPAFLSSALRNEQVMCGWLRATGVVQDVSIRAFDAARGTLGASRRLAGPLQVLSLEGGIGLEDGEVSLSLRVVLSRESDTGLETIAGELVSASSVALEVFVTVLDDVALERAVDGRAGVSMFVTRGPQEAARASATAVEGGPGWARALDASVEADRESAARPRPTAVGPVTAPASVAIAALPQRPQRPTQDVDAPVPEAGDAVDHFAFGRCDVVKSDGDRLHLRVGKEGRVREIALEMLRVTRLEDVAGRRHFKLERRI